MATTPKRPLSEWPEQQLEAAIGGHSYVAALLLLHPRNWVHRRTETVEFIDEDHLRRHHAVDFSLPSPAGADTLFVPIALLAKRVLRNFDLRDSSGGALPNLTRRQNVRIGSEAIKRAGAIALKRAKLTPTAAEQEELNRLFQDLVGGDSTLAAQALTQLRTPSGPCDHDQLTKLWSDQRVEALATDLSSKFAMYVPITTSSGQRHIIKFAYDETLTHGGEPGDPDSPPRHKPRGLRRRAKSVWRGFRQWSGIDPVVLTFYAPSVSAAQSYHLELLAPSDLIIEEATFTDSASGERLCQPAFGDVVHLTAKDRPRGSVGWVSVSLRVRSSTLLRYASLLSAVTTSMLLGGIVAHLLGYSPHTEVAAAVLIVLPGIAAGYLVRPGEHRLVQRLAQGIRRLVLIQAALCFLAAATLAVSFPTVVRISCWVAFAAVSLVATSFTTMANKRSGSVEKKSAR